MCVLSPLIPVLSILSPSDLSHRQSPVIVDHIEFDNAQDRVIAESNIHLYIQGYQEQSFLINFRRSRSHDLEYLLFFLGISRDPDFGGEVRADDFSSPIAIARVDSGMISKRNSTPHSPRPIDLRSPYIARAEVRGDDLLGIVHGWVPMKDDAFMTEKAIRDFGSKKF